MTIIEPKPPLGLTPRIITDHVRLIDILSACLRYAEVYKDIPADWIEELIEINTRAIDR